MILHILSAAKDAKSSHRENEESKDSKGRRVESPSRLKIAPIHLETSFPFPPPFSLEKTFPTRIGRLEEDLPLS